MARPDGRIEAGQSIKSAISAAAWNRAQDAADLVLGARGGVLGGPVRAGERPYTWCLAKNTTTSTVPRWGVLAITGLEIQPTSQAGGATASFEELPVLRGATPTSSTRAWVIAIEPIKANEIGRVAVAGVVQAKVEIKNSSDEFVAAGTTTSQLVTGSSGEGAILWKETGTGLNKWALVRFGAGAGGGARLKLGKTTAAWGKNSSQSIRLWPNGLQSNPAENQLATNVFATVAANRFVMIAEEAGGTWQLIAAEC
jgi:hypothetical protein